MKTVKGFRLSPLQDRLWKRSENGPVERSQCAIEIAGDLDTEILQQALRRLGERHEILRTTFRSPAGMKTPLQVIEDASRLSYREADLRSRGYRDADGVVQELLRHERSRPLDLERGPATQCSLYRLASDRYVLLVTVPALCADARSLDSLFGGIVRAYRACLRGEELSSELVQYADYSQWHNDLPASQDGAKGAEFWRRQELSSLSSPTLPFENQSDGQASNESRAVNFQADPESARRIAESGAGEEVFLLASWATLLRRFGEQPEVVISTFFDGRRIEPLREAVGLFASQLPVRCRFVNGYLYEDVLREVEEKTASMRSWQEYFPWKDHDLLSAIPYFSEPPIAFAFISAPDDELAEGVRFSLKAKFHNAEPCRLKLVAARRRDTLLLNFEYDPNRYSQTSVKRLAKHFENLLARVTKKPRIAVNEVDLSSREERHLLLVELNDTAMEPSEARFFHQLFEAQVDKTPERVAIVSGETTALSYRELNRQANRLARRLEHLGVGPESRVGIYLERGAEQLVGLVAILKAGGAYVPLDPAQPRTRLRLILDDLALTAVLTEDRLKAHVDGRLTRVVCLDTEREQIGREDGEPNPSPRLQPRNLAYVIFTSGSTGRPKGVLIEQRSLANLAAALQERVYRGKAASLRVSLNAPLTFDASVKQVVQLLAGHTLCIVPEGARADGEVLLAFLDRHALHVLECTPSQLSLLPPAFWQDKSVPALVLVGGEDPNRAIWLQLVRAAGSECHNLYGPTECTVDATSCQVRSSPQRPALGRPLANVRIRLLDGELRPVSLEAAGELCIGGTGLARGYLGRPRLTAEKFIPDPCSQGPGWRLYRTGDEARSLADGQLRFMGRRDHQVKWRGFRIELGEIEAVMELHPRVDKAVVALQEDPPSDTRANTARLVAYVTVKAEPEPRWVADELRQFLRQRLPDSMIPVEIMVLDAFPLTRSGKVDRLGLPAVSEVRKESAVADFRNPFEEVVAAIWAEVLGRERVGVEESFFVHGGHSLLATQLVSRVRNAFGVDLPLRSLFEHPTVEGLSQEVERALRGGGELQAPAILPISRGQELPLSFGQQRLWVIDQIQPGSARYNCPHPLRWQGPVHPAVLAAALDEVVRRHEVLRARFLEENGRPRQVIAAAAPADLPVIDLRALPAAARQAESRRLAAEDAWRPFDLSHGPMLRRILVRLAAEEAVLLLTMHHIVSDGWSVELLVRELATIYSAFLKHRRSPLPELAIQYADFAHWQRQWLTGEVLDRELAYWKEQLGDAPPVLELPTDRQRPAVPSERSGLAELELPEDLVAKLQRRSAQENATLFMALLAAFATLLARSASQDDLILGSPIAGRRREETEKLIGFFVNTLALRLDLSRNPSFRELLRRVRRVAVGAYSHQDLPFEKLVEKLQPERDLSRHPLFQVIFSLDTHREDRLELPGLALDLLPQAALLPPKFDLALMLLKGEQRLYGGFQFAADLFDAVTIRRMAGHFTTVLEGIADDPDQPLAELPLLHRSERHQMLREWNDTPPASGQAGALHELFEAQAERVPEAVAIVFADQRLSYRELDRRSIEVARRLHGLGVGPEVRVGVCLERSPEMVVALLAVLRAGGCYVPLDPAYPAERLSFMVRDARMAVVLTEEKLVGLFAWQASGAPSAPAGRSPALGPRSAAQVVCLDAGAGRTVPGGQSGTLPTVTAENLAYLIYTSGSTGRPKGVAIEHRSAALLMRWAKEVFPPQALAGVLASTSICFDLSIFELFVPLSWGGKVILAANALELATLPAAQEVTLINTVPSAIAELARGSSLPATAATVNLAGEPLQRRLVEQLYKEKSVEAVFNLYGPTEDTTYSTFMRAGRGDGAVTIGRPVTGTQAFILDRHLAPTPIGVPGELYLGGAGLARGYLGRPALTPERFVPNPFTVAAGGRLYRSGDLARYRGDGELEFLGRIDHQVKVRGFRIELGEIEAILSQHPAVVEAAVAVWEAKAWDHRLVAYVVTAAGTPDLPGELQRFLRAKLPAYMVPSDWVALDALPRMPNGKVERRALPEPASPSPGRETTGAGPRTPTEELLCEIWAEVLGLEKVGVDDDFFAFGGHSLLATQVVSRIRQVFRVELPLRDLFALPTVSSLAGRVDGARGSGHLVTEPPIERVSGEDPFVLSFAQERLWYLHQVSPQGAAYNMPNQYRLSGPIDIGALERALNEVVGRHGTLRTVFEEVEGVPFQRIAPATARRLPVVDLRGLSPLRRNAEAQRLSVEEAWQPFDLTRGPLLRARFLWLTDEESWAFFTMHHIISDGWSISIFTSELTALYESFSAGRPSPLPELPFQYVDFAHWQRQWLQGEVLEAELAYWKRQLGGAPAVIGLPTDRPRAAVQTYPGASRRLHLPTSTFRELQAFNRREGTTLFMTVLAVYQTLLARYSDQVDVSVGTPIAGRNRLETEGLIGFFVNTLVMRTNLAGSPSFRELLGRVREVVLEGISHQNVPFEELVLELRPQRSLSYTPLFQVFLTFENAPPEEAREAASTTICELVGGTGVAKFDLTLSLAIVEEQLVGSLVYNTILFDPTTIDRFWKHFETLLAGAVAHPERSIEAQPLLTPGDRHQVLMEWNRPIAAPSEQCCHQLFETQAERTPAAPAVVYGKERRLYGTLNRRANQLAHYLRALGVGPEVMVGIAVERSLDVAVSVLGTLKAGGAYLPLDPAQPAERLEFMLEDAKISILLTQERLLSRLPEHGARVVCLDRDREHLDRESTENLITRTSGRNLACVHYTSGSTGRPKGVALTHEGIVELARSATGILSREEVAGFLATTSLFYSCSLFEFFVPFSLGGCTILAENALTLPELSAADSVTLINIVPSAMSELISQGALPSSVRTVNLQGEAPSAELVRLLYRRGHIRKVFNGYGATEVTTYATCHLLDRHLTGTASIGRPMTGTEIFVLSRAMRPVPVGVRGEAYIAGTGLARGYVDRSRLTAEKFLPHPLSRRPGERIYRTGDLGHYLSDGRIEVQGRLDFQVKIRGLRIELQEIEAVLRQHPAVKRAVALVREDVPGNKRLAAYVVTCDEEPNPTAGDLRRFLKDRIPEFMIPAAFVMVDTLPLMANGKIDRRALPPPKWDRADLESGFTVPRNALELQLTRIWEEVLGIEPIGVVDDFFELGGHSLLAVRLLARIERELGRKVPLATLLERTTVELLADFMRQQVDSGPRSSLVAIQAGGSRSPLFFVHPSGGGVFCYADLARQLGSDQPFYGFQAQGLDGSEPPLREVETLAAHYLVELERVQPEGPYLLGGWSMGGVVAFEMAQQLRARGRAVALLALVDTDGNLCGPAVREGDSTLSALAGFAQDLGLSLDGLELDRERFAQLESDPDELLSYVLSEAKEARVVTPDLELQQIRQLFDLFNINVRAMRRYQPRSYSGRIDLFKAEEPRGDAAHDSALGWSRLADELHVYTVPGSHFTMIRRPHVRALAEQLAAILQELAAPVGVPL